MRFLSILAAATAFCVVAAVRFQTEDGLQVISGENLDGESLQNVILINSTVTSSTIRDSYIIDSEINDSACVEVQISGCQGMNNEIVSSSIQQSSFDSGSYSKCLFSGSELSGAFCDFCDFSFTDCDSCNLVNECVFQDGVISNSKMDNADFTFSKIEDDLVTNSLITGCLIEGSVIVASEFMEVGLGNFVETFIDGLELAIIQEGPNVVVIPTGADFDGDFDKLNATNGTPMEFPASNNTNTINAPMFKQGFPVNHGSNNTSGGNGTEPGTFTIETVANPPPSSPTTPPASDAADDATVRARRDKVNRRLSLAMPNRIHRAKNRK